MANVTELNNRLKVLEERLQSMNTDLSAVVQSEFKRRFKTDIQKPMQFGMYRAMCVQTIDPLKQNRVQFYSPLWTDADTTIDQLPFANQVSSMGGFDDCGLNWVPPASSTLCLMCEAGDRDAIYYIGTIWTRDRGPDGSECNGNPHNFNFPVDEYDCIWEGHRKGYLVGPNDGSQIFPPWNTENYNNFDSDTESDFYEDEAAQRSVTWPHIYGFKTPEKHMLKMVDGNAKCNRRYKRLELMSGTGNWLMFKDDHLRPCGEWSNTNMGPPEPPRFAVRCQNLERVALGSPASCGESGEDKSECDSSTNFLDCGQPKPILGDCQARSGEQIKEEMNKGTNPYFKHASECRPYRGPGTPLNPKCALPQSGFQIQSISGHNLVADDSVDMPEGCPEWERSLESFGFGSNDLYKGKTHLQSATGHILEMMDTEDTPSNRDKDNGIRIETASGNSIKLNDHTTPECTAGDERGIFLKSTSSHTIEMTDVTAKQCSPPRADKGQPAPTAKSDRNFIKLRTGYGVQIEMNDSFTQKQETQQQFLQLTTPQYDACCGPHFLRMQELPNCGYVFLRAAGDYIRSTAGVDINVVGDKEGCLGPQNKFTLVTDNFLIDTDQVYFNHAQLHVFFSESYILLLAGRDCEDSNGEPTPCIYPVIVGRCPKVCPMTGFVHWTEKSMSMRVFASADTQGPEAADGGC